MEIGSKFSKLITTLSALHHQTKRKRRVIGRKHLLLYTPKQNYCVIFSITFIFLFGDNPYISISEAALNPNQIKMLTKMVHRTMMMVNCKHVYFSDHQTLSS